MKQTPSPTGSNGRDSGGRFSKGNRVAKGNPLAKQVAALRSALLSAVTPEDVAEIVERLVATAKTGDIAAIRELFSRTLGPPLPADVLERLEAVETLMLERTQ